MDNKVRRFLFSYYWFVPIIIFFALIASLVTGCWYSEENHSLWLAVVAMGLGWTYFFQKQKLEEDKFFLSSFEKFNKRFYELSDELQAAITNDNSQNCEVLQPVIHKYFDLCLEEFQLYKAGRIPAQAWHYWLSGMRHYLQFLPIEQYWRKMESENLDDGLTIAYMEKLFGQPIQRKGS